MSVDGGDFLMFLRTYRGADASAALFEELVGIGGGGILPAEWIKEGGKRRGGECEGVGLGTVRGVCGAVPRIGGLVVSIKNGLARVNSPQTHLRGAVAFAKFAVERPELKKLKRDESMVLAG